MAKLKVKKPKKPIRKYSNGLAQYSQIATNLAGIGKNLIEGSKFEAKLSDKMEQMQSRYAMDNGAKKYACGRRK